MTRCIAFRESASRLEGIKIHMNLGKLICALSLGFLLCDFSSGHSQSPRQPDPAAQKHINETIASLPPDSSIRRGLEQGYYGDGVHERWMDDMKRSGVKIAAFEVRGVWHDATHFQPETAQRIIYRKKYDGPGSQITDPGRLAEIARTGLQAELQDAAFRKSAKAVWIGIDSPPQEGDVCVVAIYLFDDEWLADDAFSTNMPGIARYNPEDFPLPYAAGAGDVSTVRRELSTQQFPEQRLNTALFAAVTYPSDNTDVISLLLDAGANINAVRRGGFTPLIDAAGMLNLSNLKLLISAGADLRTKTNDGQTAYSVAQQQIKPFIEHNANPPEYMTQMLELLKRAKGEIKDP
jgi:hypothetical protein